MAHPLYSDTFLDHFRNPRNVGELPSPALTVKASNPVCGDILQLSAVVQDGIVTAVAYKARGCTASIAAGSAMTECVIGKRREELRSMTISDIESAVGGLIPESKHVALLCLDAVRALVATM